jgi:hypothetical protein
MLSGCSLLAVGANQQGEQGGMIWLQGHGAAAVAQLPADRVQVSVVPGQRGCGDKQYSGAHRRDPAGEPR